MPQPRTIDQEVERRDELWRHTCCELFIRSGKSYYEFNFSPDGHWAAYRFELYREEMANAHVDPPSVIARRHGDEWQLQAFVDLSKLPDISEKGPWALGLSAVIETKAGDLSYWALAHPSDRPDFHHSDSFVLSLPPVETA